MDFLVIVLACAFTATGLAAPSNVNITEDDLKSHQPVLVEPRIIGGSNVYQNVKYQVSLRKQTDLLSLAPKSLKHFCGGTLILPNIVLTAAHCVNEMSDLQRIYAVAGTYRQDFDPSTTFVSLVQGFRRHTRYVESAHDYDIAILKLEKSTPDNVNIGPVALRWKPITVGEKCTISGWGTTKYGFTETTDILQSAIVPIVDKDECTEKYRIVGYTLSPDMLCAGEEQRGVNSCQGDDGGPLVCSGELTGVYSWSHKCGEGVPGVYASVTYFRQWIDDVITQFGVVPPPNPRPPKPPGDSPGSGAKRPTSDSLICTLVFVIMTQLSIKLF